MPLLGTVEEADACFIQVSQQQVRRSRPSTEPRNPIPHRDGLESSTKKLQKRGALLMTEKRVMKMERRVEAQQTGTKK